MIPWKAQALATAVGGELSPQVDPNAELTGLVIDSRLAGPGTVFVALEGTRVDGIDFVDAAVAAGSPLAVVGRPVPGPTVLVPDPVAALGQIAEVALRRARVANPDLKVVAITGSVGKTTTKDLVARIFRSQGPTVASFGSLNNHLGVPLTVARAGLDTRYLVVEVGANHPGEIAGLARIAPPDVAVVLGVGKSHLGTFGSIEAAAATKAELVAGMEFGGMAVINMDDPMAASMALTAPDGQALTFGFDEHSRIFGSHVALTPEGHLELTVEDQFLDLRARIRTKLVGQHLAINVLAAVAAATAAGVRLPESAEALRGATADSPHRMALRELPSGATLIDDTYNASPDSVTAALNLLTDLSRASGRKAVAVLGEMAELGPSSETEHHHIGELAAAAGLERLIVVGRGAEFIREGALDAGMDHNRVDFVATPRQLAAELTFYRSEYILVKGSHNTGLMQLADELTGEGALGADGDQC